MRVEIEQFALDATKRGTQAGYSFDPASILAIIVVITQVIGMLKDCKLNATRALRRVRSPGLLDRLRLFDACKDAGIKLRLRDPAAAALLDEAQTLTTSRLSKMMGEV